MRLIVFKSILFSLMLILSSCAMSPKDYSDAAKLKPIESSLQVQTLWVIPTKDVPEYANAQLLPLVTDDRVYIANITGRVSVVNAETGKEIWKHDLGEVIASDPGIGADLIFVGTRKAEIVALDKKDGAERWRSKMTSEILAKPVVKDDLLIIQTIDGKVVALSTNTGKRLWQYEHDIPKLTLRGTSIPLIVDTKGIVGFADGKLVALNVKSGEKLWETAIATPRGRTDLERLADIDGLFQSSNGTVYVCNYQGRVAAISAEDGSNQWARTMSSYVGLAVGAGQVYVSDTLGQLWALDGRTGATLWRQDNLTGREITAPAVIGESVAVADYAGYVHWLSAEDGQFVARKSMGELWESYYPEVSDNFYDFLDKNKNIRQVTVPPLANNNVLYVRDNAGAFAAFRVVSKAP